MYISQTWIGILRRQSKCKFYFELLSSKSSSPLMHHDLPTRPWKKIGSDSFCCCAKNHLKIVGYCSLCPEVYLLTSATSSTVIEALKQTFYRSGISEELVQTMYHNTTCANSEKKIPGLLVLCLMFQMRINMRTWNTKHTISSLRYPKPNGFAKTMVKSVNKTIKKCVRSK